MIVMILQQADTHVLHAQGLNSIASNLQALSLIYVTLDPH